MRNILRPIFILNRTHQLIITIYARRNFPSTFDFMATPKLDTNFYKITACCILQGLISFSCSRLINSTTSNRPKDTAYAHKYKRTYRKRLPHGCHFHQQCPVRTRVGKSQTNMSFDEDKCNAQTASGGSCFLCAEAPDSRWPESM